MSTTTTADELAGLRATADIHETLNPIYETVRILSRELPRETTLIGFAGALDRGHLYDRGTRHQDQGPAHALKAENRAVFEGILERLTEATIEYLSKQIEAGAEVVKLFDSWAGSLKGEDFVNYALKPAAKITQALKQRHPGIPDRLPREAGDGYIGFAKVTGADCIAVDNSVSAEWVAQNVQPDSCVQGNLASSHMVTGGDDLIQETKRIVNALKGGPSHLQPRSRHHTRRKPRQCTNHDRYHKKRLKAPLRDWITQTFKVRLLHPIPGCQVKEQTVLAYAPPMPVDRVT